MKNHYYSMLTPVIFALLACTTLQAGNIEQSHKGVVVLQPKEYDTWFNKIANRQYLTGVWKLWKAESSNYKTFIKLKHKPFKWWSRMFDKNAEKQIVPLDWHQEYPKTDVRNRLPEARGGIYGINFKVPVKSRNARAILHFDSVGSECKIYVNMKLVKIHKNLFEETRNEDGSKLENFDVDITKYLKQKEVNDLKVIVFAGPKTLVWGTRVVQSAGIIGPVWIDYQSKTFVKELYLTPDLKNESLKIEMVRDSIGKAPGDTKWTFKITPWQGKRKSYKETKKLIWNNNTAKTAIKMPEADKWTPETPYLYKLEILGSKGDIAGRERFGFREFKVSNGKFTLNGEPVWLRGYLWHSRPIESFRIELEYNCKEWTRKYLGVLKKYGRMNYIRIHNGGQAKIMYDICDELGFLVSEEFDIPSTALDKNDPRRRIDFISRNHVMKLFDKNGRIKNKAIKQFAQMVKRTHNNPSVVMYNTGNERSPDENFLRYATKFYDVVHKTDRQDRPVASWGSGPHFELSKVDRKIPTDYFDFHNYDETLAGGYWNDTKKSQKAEYEMCIEKAHLSKDIPVIDGETIGTMLRLHTFNKIYRLFNEGKSEREVFIEWSKNICRWNKNLIWMHGLTLSRIGIEAFKNEETLLKAHGEIVRQLLETQRRELDFLQGIACLGITHDFLWTGSPSRTPLDPLKVEIVRVRPYIRAVGVAFNPLWISAYPFSKNVNPGRILRIKVLAHNGTTHTENNITVRVELYKNGEKVAESAAVILEKFVPDMREKLSFKLAVPATLSAGNAKLELKLLKSGKTIFTMPYNIQVIKQSKLKQVPAKFKLAVYEAKKLPQTLSALLKAANIKFIKTDDVNEALKASHLIIAPDSLDEGVELKCERLREWIENGGKLLVLEQNCMGPVPFLTEYSYSLTPPRPFADILDKGHPALADIIPNTLRDWSGTETLYDICLNKGANDIDKSILISTVGAPSTKHIKFGMAAAEVKLGKGGIFFSQLKALQNYQSDPGAKKYLDNIINYLMADSFALTAPEPKGRRKKIEYYPSAKSFFIPIVERANSGFSDRKAGDGKGGWADLGRDNLNHFKRKKYRIYGIIYNVEKTGRKNKWRNCIVLGGSIRPKLPREVKGIPVNKKLKKIGFLETAMWVKAKKGEKLGSYIVNYADGTSEEIPLINQVNIADWWLKQDFSECFSVKKIKSPSGKFYSLFITTWTNPYPDKVIASIDMKSDGNAILALIAASGILQ